MNTSAMPVAWPERDTGHVPAGNIELARQAIDAMNRRDVDWLIAHAAPDLELHARGVANEPVKYTGVAGIRENLHDVGEIWESIEHVPEDVREVGDRVIAIVRRRLRGRGSGVEVEDRIGIVWELRDGLAVRIWSYRDPDEALASVGLRSSG
jgi:ketosteroid isomerase-like protein